MLFSRAKGRDKEDGLEATLQMVFDPATKIPSPHSRKRAELFTYMIQFNHQQIAPMIFYAAPQY